MSVHFAFVGTGHLRNIGNNLKKAMGVGIDFSHIKSTRLDVCTHGECEVYHWDWWKRATKKLSSQVVSFQKWMVTSS